MKVHYGEHRKQQVKDQALSGITDYERAAFKTIVRALPRPQAIRFLRRLKHMRGRMFLQVGIDIPKHVNLRDRRARREFIRSLPLEQRLAFHRNISQIIIDAAETEKIPAMVELQKVRLRQLSGVEKTDSYEDLRTLVQMTRDTVEQVVTEFKGLNGLRQNPRLPGQTARGGPEKQKLD